MMMKRLFIYVFLCLIYIPAEAARVVDGINYEFDRDNKWAYVIKADASAPYTGNIVIPEKVKVGTNEFTVVAIQQDAFYDNDDITSLSLPESIVEIQDYAFEGCVYLRSLFLPDGLTKIGKEAFAGCTRIKELKLPDNSEIVVGEKAFANLANLKKLTIPDSWTSVGRYVFQYCGFSELQIGKNVKSIDPAAFRGCSNLTTVICSEDCVLETIGQYAFEYCSSLQDMKFLPKSVKSIGTCAFSGCSNLREVYIPYWVEELYSNSNWQDLTTKKLIIDDSTEPLTVPAGRTLMTAVNLYLGRPVVGYPGCLFWKDDVKRIDFGPYFEGGSEWKFGKNVRLIYSCVTDPTKMTFEFEEDVYDNATLYVPLGTIDDYMAQENFSKFFDVREFYPEGYLVEGALNPRIDFADKLVKQKCLNYWDTDYDCELTLSDAEAITNIGTVFASSRIITFDEFKLFTGVKSIPEKAFSSCTYLESIELPSTITKIGNKAFYNCMSLKSITIPNSVTSIGEEAFHYCI